MNKAELDRRRDRVAVLLVGLMSVNHDYPSIEAIVENAVAVEAEIRKQVKDE